MFNEENDGVEETEVVEETETTNEDDENEEGEEEQGVEYWKAEALKNKAILDRNKNKPSNTQKSGDFGYDVKAYLKASGINTSEFDFVKTEMKASGLKDVDALLENPYFKAKLENQRELNKTQEAIPKGNRSGGVATGSVEYYMGKPIEDVPLEMRRAVVNAKLEKEKGQSKFYNG